MSKKPSLSKKQLQNIVAEVYKEYPEKKIMLIESKKESSSFDWSKLLEYSLYLVPGAGYLYNLTKDDSEVEKIGRWMTDTLGFPTTTEAAEALGSEMGAFWVHTLSKFDLAGGDQDYKEIEHQQVIGSNRPAMRYSIRIFDTVKGALGAGKQLSSLTGTASGSKLQEPNWVYLNQIGDNSKIVNEIRNAKKELSDALSRIYSYAVKEKLYKQKRIDMIKKYASGEEDASVVFKEPEEVLLKRWNYAVWGASNIGGAMKSNVVRSIKSIIEDFDFEAVDRGFKRGGKPGVVRVKSVDFSVFDQKTNRETYSRFDRLHSLSSFMEFAFSKEVRRGGQIPPAEMPSRVMQRVGGIGDLYETLLIRAIPPLKRLYYQYAKEEGFLENGMIQFNAMYDNPFTDGVVQSKIIEEVEIENRNQYSKELQKYANPEVDFFVINKAIANKDEIQYRHELAIQAAAQVGFEIAAVLALGPLFGAFGQLVKASAFAVRAPVLTKMITFSIAALGIGTEIGLGVGISNAIGETVNKFNRIIEDLQDISSQFIEDVLENPAIVQDLMASHEDPEKAKQAEEALAIVQMFEAEATEAISNLEKLQSTVTNKVYEIIKTQANKTGVGTQDLKTRIGLGAGEGRFDAFEYNKEAVESSSSQFIGWHKNPTQENQVKIMEFFEMYISIAEVLDESASTLRDGQSEIGRYLEALPPSTSAAAKKKVAVNEETGTNIAKAVGFVALPNVAYGLLAALGPKGVKDITSIIDFERYMLTAFRLPQQFATNFGAKDVLNKKILDTSNIKPYLNMKMEYTRKVQDIYKERFREQHAATLYNKPEEAKKLGAYLFRPHIITVFDADMMPNWNKGKITFSFEFFNMNGVPNMSASEQAYRRFYLEEFKEVALIDDFLEALDINQEVLGKVLVSLYAVVRLDNEVQKLDLRQANQKPLAVSGGLPVINIKKQDAKQVIDLISKASKEEAIEYLQNLPEGSDNKNRFLTVNTYRKLLIDCRTKIIQHRNATSDLVNSATLAAQSLDKLIEFLIAMRK